MFSDIKSKFTIDLFLFVSLTLSILSIYSLFSAGLPPTHDGEYHVVRFYEFYKVFESGVWYPVWAPDFNFQYGSPLFLYVYPLPNFASAFFHLLGFSFIDSFKLNLIIATILGALGMYLYGRFKFGSWGGLLSSVSYTYAPYHALDVYVRGSVGEVWALGLFPFFLLFFDKSIKEKSLKLTLVSAILFSLIIFSHNILSVMFLGFIAIYGSYTLFFSSERKRIIFQEMLVIGVGMLLSSVFILPALLEQKYVVGLKVFNVLDHFPEVYQLLIPSWGSGYSDISSGTQMSFQIGVMNVIIVALCIIGLFFKKCKIQDKRYILFLLLTFLCTIFLITPFSIVLWENISVLQLFQFPWRFLSLTILLTAILTGGISVLYKSKILYILILILIIGSTFFYHKAPYFMERSDEYYIKSENFLFGTNSIGNVFQTKWLTQQSQAPTSKVNSTPGMEITLVEITPFEQKYHISLQKSELVTINTAFFPGWKAKVDDKRIDIENKNGLIAVRLPEGKSELTLNFSDTNIRTVGKIISGITFFMVILIMLKKSATIKI